MIERLPAYMIPRRFSFLESFPMNTNGKADRRRLAEALHMIPYADFLYFGILLYIALPTLLIRRWLGFSRAWVLLATAAMLFVQYGTIAHLLPVTTSESVGVTGGSSRLRRARGGPGPSGWCWPAASSSGSWPGLSSG